MAGAVANPLWQSTLFAAAAGLVALALRRNRASVRYWVWFSASPCSRPGAETVRLPTWRSKSSSD